MVKNPQKLSRFIAVLAIVFSTVIIPLYADLTIEITKGNDTAAPIAVVPFTWTGKGVSPENMSKIISGDLELSGRFKAIKQNRFQSLPGNEQEVFYRDWRQLGASYLVIGNISAENKEVTINYQLFNIKSETSILSEQVTGKLADLRHITHRISNQIYQKITGIRGVFATKILYVQAKWIDNHDDEKTDDVTYNLIYSDLDGVDAKSVLESKEPIMSPSWSPDGKQIVYVSFESGRPAIYIQTLNTGKRKMVTNYVGLNAAPVWSPDGKKLALVLSKSGSSNLYTLNIKSQKLTQLTDYFSIDNEPAWDPTGDSIYFTSNRGGSPQIYKLDIHSKRISRISFEGSFNARAKVFSDGKSLVMIHKKSKESTGYNIAVLDLVTDRLRVLSSQRFTDSPAVSPNGEMILYASQEEKKGVLGIVSVDGRFSSRLPSTVGDVREPAWSPFLD